MKEQATYSDQSIRCPLPHPSDFHQITRKLTAFGTLSSVATLNNPVLTPLQAEYA